MLEGVSFPGLWRKPTRALGSLTQPSFLRIPLRQPCLSLVSSWPLLSPDQSWLLCPARTCWPEHTYRAVVSGGPVALGPALWCLSCGRFLAVVITLGSQRVLWTGWGHSGTAWVRSLVQGRGRPEGCSSFSPQTFTRWPWQCLVFEGRGPRSERRWVIVAAAFYPGHLHSRGRTHTLLLNPSTILWERAVCIL